MSNSGKAMSLVGGESMLSINAPKEVQKEVQVELVAMEPPNESARKENKMFVIDSRGDSEGRVVVVGKASRKRATTLINIPISEGLKSCLEERVVGSLSMATAALLEWAFDELERQQISIEARPQK